MVFGLLRDCEIEKAIADKKLKFEYAEGELYQPQKDKVKDPKERQLQPSSFDLTIGKIFFPPETEYDPDKLHYHYPKGSKGAKIGPGESLFIETAETLTLADDLAAFGFPPARLSRSGLTMTNPGHVDPGYKGKLSFTIVNLGRDIMTINSGDVIATLLIFSLSGSADVPYKNSTDKDEKETRERRAKLLNQLSPDFGNFSQRIVDEAARAVQKLSVKLEWAKLLVPALAGAVSAVFIWFIGFVPNFSAIATETEIEEIIQTVDAKILSLSARIGQLEDQKEILSFDDELDALREEIRKLKNE
ncbi:MAG: hypothetical protein AAF429_02745 [Pseudomonadota bacterium]